MFEKTLTFLGLAVLATTAITAQAAPTPFDARDIHGERVGPNTLLWAHVFRAARPGQPPDCSVNTDSDATALPRFTNANLAGIAFRPAPASNFSADWVSTIEPTSFATWNAPLPGDSYFTFGSSLDSAMAKPSKFADGTNYMGMASLSGRTLAVTYVWSNSTTGRVIEADMFFSTNVNWGDLALGGTCPTGSTYDREAIATHELGHALGFDHLNVLMATMYPSASAGETRKRTLTAGEQASAVSAF